MKGYPNHVEKDQVSVALGLIDRQHTKRIFSSDLIRHGVQPVMVVIRNGSDHAYQFSKAKVDAHYIPAAEVARYAYVHPAITAARVVKWIVFFIPGLLVESIVEPTSTLDFTGIEDAARRPPREHAQDIRADFLRHEIADATLAPHGALSGVMFIQPLKLGSVIPVTLLDEHTRQPSVVEVPTPPPTYTALHVYPYPYEKVWEGTLTAATLMKGWQLVSSDKASGMIIVKTGGTFFVWSTIRQVSLMIQKVNERQTRMTLETPLRRSDSAGYGEHSPTIDAFFAALDRLFPPKAPRRKQLRGLQTRSRVPASSSETLTSPHATGHTEAPTR